MTKKQFFFKKDPLGDRVKKRRREGFSIPPDLLWNIRPLPIEDLSPQEHHLIQQLCSPRNLSLQKGKESWAARLCLQELLQHKGRQVPMEELWPVPGHHHLLRDFPQLIFSLTHTKTLAGGLLAERNQYAGVGIDVEMIDRRLASGSERHFVNSQDLEGFSWGQTEDPGQTLLKLWVLKEAAFKATFPLTRNQVQDQDPFSIPWTHQRPLVLKDLWISHQSFGLLGEEQPLGHCQLLQGQELDSLAQGQGPFLLGLAWIERKRD